MSDDSTQNIPNSNPQDDTLVTQDGQSTSTDTAAPQTVSSGGPESPRRAEVMPQQEMPVKKEQPSFIKEILDHVEQKHQSALALKSKGDVKGAVQAEEQILEEFATLDPNTEQQPQVTENPPASVQPVQPQPESDVSVETETPQISISDAAATTVIPEDSHGDEISIDDIPGVQHNYSSFTLSEDEAPAADGRITPTTISQPQVAGQMLDDSAPPIKATVTSIPTENVPPPKKQPQQDIPVSPGDIQVSKQPEGEVSVVEESTDTNTGKDPKIGTDDTGKILALGIIEGVIQKLIADSSDNLDQLTVDDSEEALYRIIEQDTLQAIHHKLVQGEWDPGVDLDFLATKLGMFAAIDVLRGLKSQALDDNSQHKIQLAIDYLMDEYDKLEIEDAQDRLSDT